MVQDDLCITNDMTALMGGAVNTASPKPRGINGGVFYLETNDKPPYAVPDFRLFNRTQIAYIGQMV